MTKSDDILAILKDLFESHDEIKACMVGKSGLEGLMMFPETFKTDVADIWEPLSNTLEDELILIDKYSMTGLKKIYFEVLSFQVMLIVLEMSDTALICFIQSDKPVEFISKVIQDFEESKRKILELIG